MIRKAKDFARTDPRFEAYRLKGNQLIARGNADMHPARR
jgi:hypothetical protein